MFMFSLVPISESINAMSNKSLMLLENKNYFDSIIFKAIDNCRLDTKYREQPRRVITYTILNLMHVGY